MLIFKTVYRGDTITVRSGKKYAVNTGVLNPVGSECHDKTA